MQIRSSIFLFGFMVTLASCSSLPSYPTDNQQAMIESTVDANYSLNKQYYVCVGESCTQATKLKPITAEDLKPLEPDVVPVIIVNKELKKEHKKRKPTRKKRKKISKPSPKFIRKCIIVPVNNSNPTKFIESVIESANNLKRPESTVQSKKVLVLKAGKSTASESGLLINPNEVNQVVKTFQK